MTAVTTLPCHVTEIGLKRHLDDHAPVALPAYPPINAARHRLAAAILKGQKDGVMALLKFRGFIRRTSVAALLPAFLTLNPAVQAQGLVKNDGLARALGIASGKAAKSSANFKQLVADTDLQTTWGTT